MKAASYANESKQTTGRADLVAKLLEFALNPSAQIGEAQNAASKMVVVARRERVGYDQLQRAIGPAIVRVTPAAPAQPEPPAALCVRMPWGQFEGKRLSWIVEHRPQYLAWLVSDDGFDMRGGVLRDAILTTLDHYGMEAAA